jgi:integrase
MPVYQRGNKWLMSLGSGKNRIRQSYDTEVEAKEAEKQEALRRLGSIAPVVTSGITMGQLYVLACKMKWNDCKSVEKLKINARQVRDYLGENLQVTQVTPTKIREMSMHFAEGGNSGATINRKLSCLSVMLNIAEEEGFINATPKMPRRRESEHRVRFMTPVEEQTALQYCWNRGYNTLGDFIQMAIDTGFRRGELLGLKFADCVDNAAVLHAGATKSGRARAVPLTQRVRAIITNRQIGKDLQSKVFHDLSVSQLRKQWESLVDYMELSSDPQFVVHMLRHTCASRLAQSGKNAPFIMQWMGHSSIVVTQRYMHLAPRALDEGLGALESFQRAA